MMPVGEPFINQFAALNTRQRLIIGQVIRLAGAEHDVGPGPEKAPGHGQADAPTGSGDDRRLALERR